jgi:hypothetical protein
MLKLIAILAVISVATADLSSKNAEIKAEMLSTVKYAFRTYLSGKSYADERQCLKIAIGFSEDEVESAKDYETHDELIASRKYPDETGFLLKLTEKYCEKADLERVKKMIEMNDNFSGYRYVPGPGESPNEKEERKLNCMKEKLTQLDPDSLLLANFDPAKVENCEEFNETCSSEEKNAKIFNEFGLKSCKSIDFNEDCARVLRREIALGDNSLPLELRVDQAFLFEQERIELAKTRYSCIFKEIFSLEKIF